jgi:hypothetical protein
MGFTGLVPASTPPARRCTAGTSPPATRICAPKLIESAWAYQHAPNLGAVMRRRQHGLDPATVARSWRAQKRLCGRLRRLSSRTTSRNVVTVAIARELAGFLWAE